MESIASIRRNRLRMAGLFLLFATFFLLLFIPCYYYVRNITRSNVLELHRQKLEDGVRSLNTSLEAMSNLHTMLDDNTIYRAMNSKQSEIDTLQLSKIRESVLTYLLPYDAVAEAGLSRQNHILFTRKRIYYQLPELVASKFFYCEGMSTEQFTSQFSGVSCVIPAAVYHSADYGSYEGFTVAWQWSRTNQIYFFATYPVERVFALMAEKNVRNLGNVSIYLGDTLIASSGRTLESDYEWMEATASSVRLRIRVQIPNSYIEQDLSQIKKLAQTFLLIIVIAAIVWIVLFATAAARPLNRLTRALYSTKHLSIAPGGKGSISNLVGEIKDLDLRLSHYENTIAAQGEKLKSHMMEKALYRGLYNKDFRAAFEKAFPQFLACWQMALIQYATEENEVDEEKLTLLFSEYMRQRLPKAIFLPTDKDTMLAIMPYEDGQNPEDELEKLRMEMRDRYGVVFRYILSEIYEDPASLVGAYQQLEYENSISLKMDASIRREKVFPLSLQQLQTMYMALSCGDEKIALEMLAACTSSLADGNDFFLAKYTHQTIANMLVMIKMESACEMSDILIPSFIRQEISKLYREDFPKCFKQIAERITLQRKNQTQDLDKSILTYIDDNLNNSLLCISMVTDHFQISAPTLQKRLHSAVGQTFSAYVEDMRLNKARNELRDTDLTVQEISEKCGYATPNSFYKAYKRRFGETPLAVREQK